MPPSLHILEDPPSNITLPLQDMLHRAYAGGSRGAPVPWLIGRWAQRGGGGRWKRGGTPTTNGGVKLLSLEGSVKYPTGTGTSSSRSLQLHCVCQGESDWRLNTVTASDRPMIDPPGPGPGPLMTRTASLYDRLAYPARLWQPGAHGSTVSVVAGKSVRDRRAAHCQ
eukprot:763067-Hanusia_phi.AAC.2